jgi:2-hydroxy-3-oxopropionate reductase
MGFHMARRLSAAGHRVRAWNRTAARAAPLAANGVELAASPVAAASDADAAILMLTDGPVCDAVLDTGFAAAMAPSGIVVAMSSIPPWTAQSQAARVRPRRYVDAPVSGGEGGARDGTLAIMAGGAAEDIDALRPIFDILGRVTRIGPVGAGQLAKLANQLIVGITIGAVAEALVLAEAGGADPAAVRTALAGGFADSRILREHGARMIARDFSRGARSAIQLKDLRTIREQAARLGLDLPIAALTEQLFAQLCDEGDAERDHSALIRHMARRSARPVPG